MRRAARLAAAFACAAAALACHETFCEWRTVRVPAERAGAEHARALLEIRAERHAEGNAAEWDRGELAVRAYDRDWLACHREIRGDPAAGSPLAECLARRPYTIHGATAEAVARGECELELHGELQGGAAFAACLARSGHRETPIPRWPYERLGPRFTGPWIAETALFAEREVAGLPLPHVAAIAGGIALPGALVAAAVALLIGRASRAP
jgi:hypothetical protein